MKGLDPKRSSELFRSNSKKHFKMYKAGTKWLVAGISTLAGLLGMGSITSSAKADTTKASAAKTVDTEEVSATKTTGTIPATSQVSSQVTSTTTANTSTSTNETSTPSMAQTSTTDAASATTNTAANSDTTNSTSTATDQKTATASVSTNETSTTSTAQTSTTPAASTSTTTSTTSTNDETSVAASTSTAKTSTNDLTSNATASTTQTSGSTSMTTEASASASASATASQSEDVATAAAATLQLQNLMRTAVNTLGISAESLDLTTENGIMALSAAVKNELSTPKEYGDSKAYSTGYSDAKSDIESYIKEFYVASGSILNVATLTAAITAAGGLNGYMKKLGDGISAISNLLSAYEQNNDLQASDNYGASTWQGSSYRTGSVTSSSFKLPADGFAGLLGGTVSASTKDYNQGYADYARDVAKGLNAWITQIKTNADDASNADVFANAQTYKPADLSGDTSIGASGSAFDNTITSVLKSAVGADGKYATNVLNYTKITGIADDANSDVSDAVSNLKIFIKVIAPYLVNGIAHQALSDVRSIGGTIEDSDYTPSDLEKAMSLNSGMMSVMTDLLGLTKAQLSEPLMNGIYNAIKGNVQKSIEKSWAVGEGKALTGFLQNDSDNIYDGAKSAPSAYTSLSGYSETNPGNLLGSV